MKSRVPLRRFLAAVGLLVVAGGAGFLAVRARLRREVGAAAAPEAVRAARVRELRFVALRPRPLGSVAGDGSIDAVALDGEELITGGGSGFAAGPRRFDTRSGLPSLRASAVTSWRGTPVFALARGGFGRLSGTGLELASTGWGDLEVRALLETASGELLVGARQGLFRAPFGAGELERLDRTPVRALALAGTGSVAAGGESGLRLVPLSGAAASIVALPDSWVDDLGFSGGTLWAATASGIALGPISGSTGSLSLAFHPRGTGAGRGVLVGERFVALPAEGVDEGAPRVVLLAADGSRTEEEAPERFRKLFVSGGVLADGPSGLWRHTPDGFRRVIPREAASLPRPHVNALATRGETLWAGFFDGGLARGAGAAASLPASWTTLEGSGAWGVNALLPAGGSLYAATLRGTFRVDGDRVRPLDQGTPLAAFSLASTRDGLAVGLGQGVFLPGRRLLSAFHGLPGNQAVALASSREGSTLWVGTPSGLGRIDGRRVVRAARPGDGRLPHPWVTALAELPDGLLVGTWGGGVSRRAPDESGESWTPFPETEGLKVNAGAFAVEPSGRVWFGTQGRGLWRSDAARTRFERVAVPLPSPDVFALALFPEDAPTALVVGTGEGLLRLPLDSPTEEP